MQIRIHGSWLLLGVCLCDEYRKHGIVYTKPCVLTDKSAPSSHLRTLLFITNTQLEQLSLVKLSEQRDSWISTQEAFLSNEDLGVMRLRKRLVGRGGRGGGGGRTIL